MAFAVLEHGPELRDDPTIRPALSEAVKSSSRAARVVVGLGVGGAAGLAAHLSPDTGIGAATIGAAALTAIAANWSTCGLSVAGVVAAPKQPGRRGASTPLRRLGLHALGSVSTGSVTGALFGALGAVSLAAVHAGVLLVIWAVLAAAYGLHELGLLTMPTPMRRRQLPRHLRRTMDPRKVSFLFGAMIGPGFLIFIRSSAYYLLVLGTVMAGSPLLGAALFTVVSLGRCGPSLAAIVHTRRGGTMPDFLTLTCRIDRRVQAATGMLLTALGAFALSSLL